MVDGVKIIQSNKMAQDKFENQSTYEKFSGQNLIFDKHAEDLLKKYTKRREGLSDLPKNYMETLKAEPGYGLPNIDMRSNRNVQSPASINLSKISAPPILER